MMGAAADLKLRRGLPNCKSELESELEPELDAAAVAREVLAPLGEPVVAREQEAAIRGLAGQADRVHEPGGVLRVVEGVREIGAEFDRLALAHGELLAEREVEVVDARHLEGVAPGVRERA